MNNNVIILIVEDNEGDIELTLEAFSEAKLQNTIYTVRDGIEAMDFLRKKGIYHDMPRPDIILLDLNMPRMDGREVLHEVKNDAHLKQIPIIVLTTSDNEMDIIGSYAEHANCYIKKPVNFENFYDVVKQIEGFWLSVVKLPPKE